MGSEIFKKTCLAVSFLPTGERKFTQGIFLIILPPSTLWSSPNHHSRYIANSFYKQCVPCSCHGRDHYCQKTCIVCTTTERKGKKICNDPGLQVDDDDDACVQGRKRVSVFILYHYIGVCKFPCAHALVFCLLEHFTILSKIQSFLIHCAICIILIFHMCLSVLPPSFWHVIWKHGSEKRILVELVCASWASLLI